MLPLPPCRAFPKARALAKEGAAKQLVAALRGHDAHPQPVVTALSNALKQVQGCNRWTSWVTCVFLPAIPALAEQVQSKPFAQCRWLLMMRSARRWRLLVVWSWLFASWKQVRLSDSEPDYPATWSLEPTLRPPLITCYALHCAGMSDASTARPLCALLRQLVSSDSNKELFVECGGLELLATLFGVQGSSPAVLEQALGLLTNVTLRYPEAAARVRPSALLSLLSGPLASQYRPRHVLPPGAADRLLALMHTCWLCPAVPCRPQPAAAWMQHWS